MLDLETANADRLFTYRPHDRQGFVRLAAWSDNVATDVSALLDALDGCD